MWFHSLIKGGNIKMVIVQDLYDFFGFDLLSQSATFTDLISYMLQVGIGVWITVFIIRSLFLATTVGRRRI